MVFLKEIVFKDYHRFSDLVLTSSLELCVTVLFIPMGVLTCKAYQDGSLFHQKSFDMGPILVIKILRGGSHFRKIAKKMVKSAVFEAEKPLEMGLNLQKFRKNCLTSCFFEWDKSLDMGRGFGPGLHTLSKNNLSTPRVFIPTWPVDLPSVSIQNGKFFCARLILADKLSCGKLPF